MAAWFLDILIGLLFPPVAAFIITRWVPPRGRVPSVPFFAGWSTGAGAPAILNASLGNGGMASCEAASFAVAVTAWFWWRRRKRDRAPRAYGAKSKALIAALVTKAREAAKPRPVLRPAPGGAR